MSDDLPFTNPPDDDLAATQSLPDNKKAIGSLIGPYKLLELIGEGGMGSVYLAQQDKPIKRRVALKLIKSGTDSQQVIARFENERQALALMEHPNIAKFYDAGTASTGNLYFAMEYVPGTPITKFCDEKRLTIEERLKLFGKVCKAVQHAHQKGIIHRDLKPSNIVVSMVDNEPVPKVIDFGLAKATGVSLTDQTLHTQFGQVLGTLQYMSPEQAGSQTDIDTRTDIHSLGAILYELLVGSPPFEKETIKSKTLDEVVRMIREEDPPTPKQRLDSSHTNTEIALADDDKKRLFTQFSQLAFARLRNAIESGYFQDPSHVNDLRSNKFFDPIRKQEEFKSILKQIEGDCSSAEPNAQARRNSASNKLFAVSI